MNIDLTTNQIKILIAHDPSFLDTLLDLLLPAAHGLPVLDQKTIEFCKNSDNNKIRAIRSLREWSVKNQHHIPKDGSYTFSGSSLGSALSLMSSKYLVEKYWDTYNNY